MVNSYQKYCFSQVLGSLGTRNSNFAVSSDGKLFFSAVDETLCVWNIQTFQLLVEVRIVNVSILDKDFSHAITRILPLKSVLDLNVENSQAHCDCIALGFSDGSIRLIRTDSIRGSSLVLNENASSNEATGGNPNLAVLTHDGSHLSWIWKTARLVNSWFGHKRAITSLAESYCGTLLISGSADTDIVIWDRLSDVGVCRLRGHEDLITSVMFWDKLNNLNVSCFSKIEDDSIIKLDEEEDNHYGPKLKKIRKKSKKTSQKNDSRDTSLLTQALKSDRTNMNNSRSQVNHSTFQHTSATETGIPSAFSSTTAKTSKIVISTSKDGLIKIWDYAIQLCIQTITCPSNTSIWTALSLPIAGIQVLVIGDATKKIRMYVEDNSTGEFKASGIIERKQSSRLTHFLLDNNGTQILALSQGSKRVEIFTLCSETKAKNRQKKRLKRQRVQKEKRIIELEEEIKYKTEIWNFYKGHTQNIKDQENDSNRQTGVQPNNSNLKRGRRNSNSDQSVSITDNGIDYDILALNRELLQLKTELTNPSANSDKISLNMAKDFCLADYIRLERTIMLPSKPLDAVRGPGTSLSFVLATNSLLTLSQKNLLTLDITDNEKKTTMEDNIADIAQVSVGHAANIQHTSISKDDLLLLTMAADSVRVWFCPSMLCTKVIDIKEARTGFFIAGNQCAIVGTVKGVLSCVHLNSLEKEEVCVEGTVQAVCEFSNLRGFWAIIGKAKLLKKYEFFVHEKQVAVGLISFREIDSLDLHEEPVALSVSENGKFVFVSFMDNTIHVRYGDTGKPFLTLVGHSLPVSSLAVSSDSELLASGSADKIIKIWNCDFGNIQLSLRGHDAFISQVQWIPKTHYLVSASFDRSLRIWDVDRNTLISVLSGHQAQVSTFAFSLDAAFIISAAGNSLRVWNRSDQQLFLEEEKEKEIVNNMESGAARDDREKAVLGAADEALATRPTRRTMETVRTTEKLMEMIDVAFEQFQKQKEFHAQKALRSRNKEIEKIVVMEEPSLRVELLGMEPHEYVVKAVMTLTPNNIGEVLIALPWGYAEKLLSLLAPYCETLCRAINGMPQKKGEKKKLKDVKEEPWCSQQALFLTPLENVCRTVLLIIQIHFRMLCFSANHRPLLSRFKDSLRIILRHEKERLQQNARTLDIYAQELEAEKQNCNF